MGVNLKRIKAYRAYNDMSQQDIAVVLNITKSSYALKEQGVTEFTSSEIGKMAEIFEVDPGDLFRRDKQLAYI